MVSAQAAAVQRDDHLSVRLRRAAKPHSTAAGGERGAQQGKVVDFTAASGAGAPTQLMEERYPSYVTHRMGIFI